MSDQSTPRTFECRAYHMETYVAFHTVTASSPVEALQKLRDAEDDGGLYFSDYIDSETAYLFVVEADGSEVTHEEPANDLRAVRALAEQMLQALELCEDALSDLARLDDDAPSISALQDARDAIGRAHAAGIYPVAPVPVRVPA